MIEERHTDGLYTTYMIKTSLRYKQFSFRHKKLKKLKFSWQKCHIIGILVRPDYEMKKDRRIQHINNIVGEIAYVFVEIFYIIASKQKER